MGEEERLDIVLHAQPPHSQVTHHGARVAPQRCPILRVSIYNITAKENKENFLENHDNLPAHCQGRGHGQENPRTSYGNRCSN
jgi:hypothetical protein